ncbi:MAG TPA: type II toxin-antitoxin system VapC family toxin [Candidatus Binataceae bacterium]|jgi:predicted nucleic acid-binding protein|nr:type II toxin-antitoxin system VapC family toxin [Candidatus Binataceae bacterium]
MPISRTYFDTSALVKRYVHEEGSVQARTLLRNYRVVSSAIAPLEALSALLRRRALGQLSERDLTVIRGRMRVDIERWELLECNETVLGRAEEVIEAVGGKTLDALHIASALVFQEASLIRVGFVTADARQTEAARRMALKVTRIGER